MKMTRRSSSHGRSNWALVGLAMHIAHGLRLHQDGNGQTFNAFEAEMRRRLFWQLLTLDIRASEDRGFEPIVADNSFNTAMPCNLNDEDFGHDSKHPLQGRIGRTDMTLCLLEMDALHISWKIILGSSTSGTRRLSLNEREDLVREYAHRVETTYVAGCGMSDQRARLLCVIGQYWIHKLRLILYNPLHNQEKLQQFHSSTQSLATAVEFLKSNILIEDHPSAVDFSWLFRTYAPWHAIAVVLAEICDQPTGGLADVAWEMIESRFRDWKGRVAGNKEVLLWDPIKKLLKRARAARQQSQKACTSRQTSYAPNMDSYSPDVDVSLPLNGRHTVGDSSREYSPHPYDNLQPLVGQNLNSFHFAPVDTMPTGLGQPGSSSNLDSWNNFMYDVNALGEGYHSEIDYASGSISGFSM